MFFLSWKRIFIWHETTQNLRHFIERFKSVYEVIDRLPLRPKNKVMIVSRYVSSKLRWNLSIYEVSETWTIQNLESIVKIYIKRWLQLHQGANFRHLHLPIKKFGMKFSLPSDIYRFCQLSKRNIRKNSLNDEIKEL